MARRDCAHLLSSSRLPDGAHREARAELPQRGQRSGGRERVIANNQHRKAKKLFTSAEDGDKIQVYMAADERDEGRWIAGEIEKQRAAGLSYNQVAVFYRTNAQSRMLEDMLLRAGVPYRIVGGTRFFDRAEIRDVMAYLTLVVNPADDIAAKRVINVPRRGIGKTTIERIEQFAREMGMTFMEGAELAIVDPELRASARQAIGEFVGLVNEARTYGGDLRKVIETIIDKSGLIGALQAENTDEARGRIENIQEFLGVVDEFTETHEDEDALYEAPTAEPADAPALAPVPSSADAPAGSFYAFAGANELAAPAEESPVRVLRGDSLADFIDVVLEAGTTRLWLDVKNITIDGKSTEEGREASARACERACEIIEEMGAQNFCEFIVTGNATKISSSSPVTIWQRSLAAAGAVGSNAGWMSFRNPADYISYGYPWANLSTENLYFEGKTVNKNGYSVQKFLDAGLKLSVYNADLDVDMDYYLAYKDKLYAICTNYPRKLLGKWN